MKIGHQKLDKESNAFIIAELSANHGGSLEVALETVRAAKRAGADAIKLQTYKPETITLLSDKEDFKVSGGTLWDGRTLYDLYEEAHTPWEWHKDIFECAKQEGLVCFSSPFNKTAVDFLEALNVPAFKIASFEITDIPLIKYAASKGKPMILSTGIATLEDIELALRACRDAGATEIGLLKCTSSYPAPIEQANLRMIQEFERSFNVVPGLSDHTLGATVPMLSVAMGAKIIEKHFILDKSLGGPDASFSLDEGEFKEMVDLVRLAEKALGQVSFELTDKQKQGRSFSRSLYISKDIRKGEYFTEENVRSVRPGFGLHPKFYDEILGERAKTNLEKGDRLKLNNIEKHED